MSNLSISFDESMLEIQEFDEKNISSVVNECDRWSKVGFLPEIEASYLGLILHVMDLTSLNNTDTYLTIEALVDKALMYSKNSLTEDIEKMADNHSCNVSKYFRNSSLTPQTICVSSIRVSDAVRRLHFLKQHIEIASVAGGFPMGTIPLGCRISEVEYAIGQGATEIDMVIDRALVLTGNYEQLYNELRAIKCACIAGKVTLKTILSVSELGSYQTIYKACMTAMMAGSDFIKTSTGKESENATLSHGVVMCEAIKKYYDKTGYQVGLKAAGGIKFHEQALGWLMLVKNQLGNDWMETNLFRIGASSLLDDLVKRLGVVLKKLQ